MLPYGWWMRRYDQIELPSLNLETCLLSTSIGLWFCVYIDGKRWGVGDSVCRRPEAGNSVRPHVGPLVHSTGGRIYHRFWFHSLCYFQIGGIQHQKEALLGLLIYHPCFIDSKISHFSGRFGVKWTHLSSQREIILTKFFVLYVMYWVQFDAGLSPGTFVPSVTKPSRKIIFRFPFSYHRRQNRGEKSYSIFQFCILKHWK